MTRGTLTSIVMLTLFLSTGCQTNQRSKSSAYRSSGNYSAKYSTQKKSSSQMANKKQAPKRLSDIASQDATEVKPKAPPIIASRRAEQEKPVMRSEAQATPRYSEIFLPPSPSTNSKESRNSNPVTTEKKISSDYVPPAAPGIRSPTIRKQ
ncbi:MAG TPA: hypothetical protein DD473_03575 [Planctomycetaceae bacterium]|nr:hypothetical protein [Planctomycetaceae bacterium]